MAEIPSSDRESLEPSKLKNYENKLAKLKAEKEGLEFTLLELQVENSKISSREAEQRYNLRGWATVVTSIIIILMGFLLNAVVVEIYSFKDLKNVPIHVVFIYVAPIVSITTLAISLLVAAFRGYKDSDANDTADLASKASSTTSSIL